MNKDWTVYDPVTGLFTGTHLNCDDLHVEINIPLGMAVIAGHFDHLSQRLNLETKTVEDWQPPQPSVDHEWNATAKRWALTEEAATRASRKSDAYARIGHLEANVQPRAVREVQLGRPESLKRLKDIDNEIAELREQLSP